ncbi:MAG: ACT domain-containing protein [Halobacteriales archaeon]
MSLAQQCRRTISRHPHLLHCLRDDVVNYRALARHIKPEVEHEVGAEVDIEAVTTAVRRYSEDLRGSESAAERARDVVADSRVSLRGNVVSITARKVSEVSMDRGFLHVVRGREYTTVVTDDTRAEEIVDSVDDVVEIHEDLTCITVESPEDIVDVPGVLAHMVSRFTTEDINIVDVTSCYTETIIVVEKRDAVRALETLEEVIEAS